MPQLTNPITADGPIVDFLCGVSQPRADALQRAGLSAPQSLPIKALLDTGASISVLDADVLSALGINLTGTVLVHTPSTSAVAPHLLALFDVSLAVNHSSGSRVWSALPVLEASLAHQGIQALIGRDILNSCILTYNGSAGTFILE